MGLAIVLCMHDEQNHSKIGKTYSRLTCFGVRRNPVRSDQGSLQDFNGQTACDGDD